MSRFSLFEQNLFHKCFHTGNHEEKTEENIMRAGGWFGGFVE